MIILISAVIVDISILINSYIEINGIIFINIFFVAVITSIFWYIDNPFRRIFENISCAIKMMLKYCLAC